MGFPDYKRDLLAAPFEEQRVLDRYFHSGQSVVFNGAGPDVEPAFKRALGRRISTGLGVELHPLQLIICGSAHLGFSPVPEKLGKPFDSSSSDIDVAIVSEELFDSWWAELQASDIVQTVRTRFAENLFWGFIDPATIHDYSQLGRKWWALFGEFETDRARAVRGRLYRSFWSMQNYHRRAINGGRKTLMNMRT